MATTITTEGEIRVGPGHQVIDIYVRRSHNTTVTFINTFAMHSH